MRSGAGFGRTKAEGTPTVCALCSLTKFAVKAQRIIAPSITCSVLGEFCERVLQIWKMSWHNLSMKSNGQMSEFVVSRWGISISFSWAKVEAAGYNHKIVAFPVLKFSQRAACKGMRWQIRHGKNKQFALQPDTVLLGIADD